MIRMYFKPISGMKQKKPEKSKKTITNIHKVSIGPLLIVMLTDAFIAPKSMIAIQATLAPIKN